MSEKVRLKDIADALGVSIVTASNALSGKKGVSDSMRQKIVGKAKELGYDADKYNTEAERSPSFGVIVSGRYISVGTSFYWELYQKTAYAASKKHSFTMLEIVTYEDEVQCVPPQMLSSDEIEGIIVIGRMDGAYMKKIVAGSVVPVVLLDFYNPSFGCDAVLSGNYLGMYKATKYLIDHGHKEIGFVGTIELSDNIRDRYFGYLKAMKENSLAVREEWILPDRDLVTMHGEVRLPEDLPTAFACSSDYTAGLLYDALMKKGLEIPRDISCVGYDDYLYGHPLTGKLTTYRADTEKMAELAVSILKKKVRNGESYRGAHYVDGPVIERSSVLSAGTADWG